VNTFSKSVRPVPVEGSIKVVSRNVDVPGFEMHSFSRPTELPVVVLSPGAVCRRWMSHGSPAYKAVQLTLLPTHPFVRSRTFSLPNIHSSSPIALSTHSLTFLHIIKQYRLKSHQLNTRTIFSTKQQDLYTIQQLRAIMDVIGL